MVVADVTKVQAMLSVMAAGYLKTLEDQMVSEERRCQRYAQWVKEHTEKGHPEAAERNQKKLDHYLKVKEELGIQIQTIREGLGELKSA